MVVVLVGGCRYVMSGCDLGVSFDLGVPFDLGVSFDLGSSLNVFLLPYLRPISPDTKMMDHCSCLLHVL